MEHSMKLFQALYYLTRAAYYVVRIWQHLWP